MHAAQRTLLAFALTALVAHGPITANAAEEALAPKTAAELLNMVQKRLSDLSAFSCSADMAIEVKSAGTSNKLESSYSISVDKPRRWAIEMTSGMFGGSSFSDGNDVTTFLGLTKKYTVEPLPEDWDPAKSDVLTSDAPAMVLGPAAFSSYFVGHALDESWMKAAESGTVKAEALAGEGHWVARFDLPAGKAELWVAEEGSDPLRQIVFTPDLGDRGETMSMRIRVTFKDWQASPKFTDADFVFDPPADAEKADSLMGGMVAEEGPHPLVGEPAPEFEADVLDGKKFKLADALAKKDKVVMLDFWATWCGPCVDALPEVTAAAKEAGKGVVFYAVNIQDEPDAVREFLAGHKLTSPVLLDADGDIAGKYQANAIPQTVLIGKDGRVQVVHVGGSAELKKVLLADLKKLLAGEDLAAETLRKHEEKSKEEDAEAVSEDDSPEDEVAETDDADAASEDEAASER